MMRLIIISIYIFAIFTLSSHGNEIHYSLSVVNDKLEVTIEFRGNSSGVTEVLIPALSNIDYKDIKAKSIKSELRIVDNLEKKRRERNCSNVSPNVCDIFYIFHEPNEEITLVYSQESIPGVMIFEDNIVFESFRVFAFPHARGAKQISLDVSMLNYKHKKIYDEKILKNLKNTMPNDSHIFFDGIYIFSNSEIKNFSSKDNKSRILGVNFRNITKTNSLIRDINDIKENNRKFISYLLDMIPYRSAFKEINKNSDIILINIDNKKMDYWAGYSNSANFITINNKIDYAKFLQRVSHENLHSFFSTGRGVSVNFGPKIKWNHFWFDEGFNEYYANLLNYRAKIISPKQYINRMNEQLEEYYKFYMYRHEFISSSCGETMIDLLNEDYNFKLFYNAGMMIALDMDNILKKGSKLRLENVLKKSVQKACKNIPCTISKEIFLDELSKGAKHISPYIDKHVINFRPMRPSELPESIPDIRSKLNYKLHNNVASYGFDINKTLCTGVIYGVNEKGNAYKKGLRNGMKITELKEGEMYEKGWYISVEIEKTDLTKVSIKYSPLQEELIPYYKLAG